MFTQTPEKSIDQAAGLRRIVQPHPVKVVAVTGGKGGVGKTNVSVNLATALAQHGKQVMLMDADLGLANVDVLLGLTSRYNLSHVISGESTLAEIIMDGPAGVKIIPAASGKNNMINLTTAEHGGLIHAFGELDQGVDVLLIDTAAGISDSVITFTRAAHEVIIVVCDEPASVTDAYALIKILNRDHGVERFHVLANMTTTAYEGQALFKKLASVAQRFLDVTLNFMGGIPHDEYLRKAVQRQQTVMEAFPRSRSAVAFRKLADKTDRLPLPSTASGQLEFFVERLIMSGCGYQVHDEVPA